jgi:hypothetical protein
MNTLAVPVLVHGFGIVSCLRKGITIIDGKMRKLVTFEGIHHLKVDVNRFYIKIQNGGHGLFELASAYNAAVGMASTLSKAILGLPD